MDDYLKRRQAERDRQKAELKPHTDRFTGKIDRKTYEKKLEEGGGRQARRRRQSD